MNKIYMCETAQEAAICLIDMDYATDTNFLFDAYNLRKDMGIKEKSPICPTCHRIYKEEK